MQTFRILNECSSEACFSFCSFFSRRHLFSFYGLCTYQLADNIFKLWHLFQHTKKIFQARILERDFLIWFPVHVLVYSRIQTPRKSQDEFQKLENASNAFEIRHLGKDLSNQFSKAEIADLHIAKHKLYAIAINDQDSAHLIYINYELYQKIIHSSEQDQYFLPRSQKTL